MSAPRIHPLQYTREKSLYKRILLLAVVLSGLFVFPGQRAPVEAAVRVRWGYYTGYDKTTSLPSLRAHAADLNYVSPWYGFDIGYDGRLTGKDDPEATAIAKAAGAKVLPLVQNKATYDAFHNQISNSSTRTSMIQSISDMVYTHGYHGVNIDFEALSPGDRPHLTEFMRELYATLHPRGKLVTMAVAAKTRDATTGWAGAYDYAALAPHADLFVIMAYDYSYKGSLPGGVAPVNWVREVAMFANSHFGAQKVVVGLPFYGYDWNVTTKAPATSVKFPQIEDLRKNYNATLSYDTASESARASYTRDGERHEVWYENGRSFDAKLAAIRGLGAAGVAVWRLGQEDPGVWSSMRGLSVGVSAPSFSPNGDGYGDSVVISYRSESTGTISLDLLDSAGKSVYTIQGPTQLDPGLRTVRWNGRDSTGTALPDGKYAVRVTSTVAGSPVTDTAAVAVHSAVRGLTTSPGTDKPARDSVQVAYTLAQVARVQVLVTQGRSTVRTLTRATDQPAGSHSVSWDGNTAAGTPAPEGGYSIVVRADTASGRGTTVRDVYLDRRAPEVTNVRVGSPSYYVNGGTDQVWSYYLSEPASVSLTITKAGQPLRTLSAANQAPGRNITAWRGSINGALAPAGPYTYTLMAMDAAGNQSTVQTGAFTITR